MTGRRILLRGTVEGVGMRPAIARFAAARGLSGWVRNGGDAVECVFFGPEPVLEAACRDLPSALPPQGRPETPWQIEPYKADPPPLNVSEPPYFTRNPEYGENRFSVWFVNVTSPSASTVNCEPHVRCP